MPVKYANAAGAPLPSSILTGPSSPFSFPLPACAKSVHGCDRPAELDPYRVPQHVPRWTALLEGNSAQYPGQGDPQAVQAVLAVERIASATAQVVVGNGAGNETRAEHGEAAAGTLDVLCGVGAAKPADCVGTGGAGRCGGLSNVGWGTAAGDAGDAEAIDGALHAVPRDWSDAGEGNLNNDDDPGAGALAMLDDAEDGAGALVAVE